MQPSRSGHDRLVGQAALSHRFHRSYRSYKSCCRKSLELTESMRAAKVTICLLVCVAAGAIILEGCTSQENMARAVRASRQAAYRQWQSRKDEETGLQPRITGKLTLVDAVNLTLGHNKMLQRTLEEKNVAYGQVVASRSAWLPSISVNGRFQRQELVPVFTVTVPTVPPAPPVPPERVQIGTLNNYSVDLAVVQPIFAGGAITAQVRAAKILSLLTDQTVRAATQDVVYTAETAYYQLLLSQHLVAIDTDAVRASKVHLDDVEKKRAGGVASDFDVLRAQVELSNFEASLIKSKNAINIARANLIKTMGVSQDSDFVLADEFAYVPIEVSMEQAVEVAYTNRPDLYSREYEIRAQREQLQIARSRYLPNISGFFTNTWSSPSPTAFGSSSSAWGRIWVGGLQGTWPIFDGFQREGTIIQEKARLREAQISLVDAEETALYELTRAILSMKDAEEFVQSQRLNLTRANEGLRLAEVGYQQGINTQVEVIDAQSALTQARVNYYQAIYSHVVAKLAVQRAMGTIVESQDEPAGPSPAVDQPQTQNGGKQDEKG
jgi:outer membrane protein